MSRQRKAFVVYVDLDPTPGTMHTAESAHNVIRNVLHQRMPNYNPIVSIAPASLQPEDVNTSEYKTIYVPAGLIQLDRLIFDSKERLSYVMGRFEEKIAMHGQASIADLYRLVGVPEAILPGEERWGWTRIKGYVIAPVSGHRYIALLPEYHYLHKIVSRSTNTEGNTEA